jgi:hypothetical protein
MCLSLRPRSYWHRYHGHCSIIVKIGMKRTTNAIDITVPGNQLHCGFLELKMGSFHRWLQLIISLIKVLSVCKLQSCLWLTCTLVMISSLLTTPLLSPSSAQSVTAHSVSQNQLLFHSQPALNCKSMCGANLLVFIGLAVVLESTRRSQFLPPSARTYEPW